MITPKLKAHVEKRLRAWYDLATSAHKAAGQCWYTEAHAFVVELAKTTGLDVVRVAGVVAALSPSVYWAVNKRQAEALCRAHADGLDLRSVSCTTYGRQVAKAHRILNLPTGEGYSAVRHALGNPGGRSRAFKTQAFLANILHSDGDTGYITIDQHIVEAAGMEEFFTQSAKWCYDLVADVIRSLAVEYGYLPHELQAIIWITYKHVQDARAPAERAEDQRQIEHLPF